MRDPKPGIVPASDDAKHRGEIALGLNEMQSKQSPSIDLAAVQQISSVMKGAQQHFKTRLQNRMDELDLLSKAAAESEDSTTTPAPSPKQRLVLS